MFESSQDIVGKTVAKLYIGDDRTFSRMEFSDGTALDLLVAGDCCSESWIEHLSGVSNLLGHQIISVEMIDLPEGVRISQREIDSDCLAFYSMQIRTQKGLFELEYRNDSNGYYGGYVIISNKPFEQNLIEVLEDF